MLEFDSPTQVNSNECHHIFCYRYICRLLNGQKAWSNKCLFYVLWFNTSQDIGVDILAEKIVGIRAYPGKNDESAGPIRQRQQFRQNEGGRQRIARWFDNPYAFLEDELIDDHDAEDDDRDGNWESD
ncbi:hypothetical protein G6011_06784 [Alternaria panax]|uniref:Uncharacterized protein n=1 Tax=Alternaria panax TaxID=48097 RepID=A0AAD4FK18_9PLEO|nr:hypothetical protein G6011_06784 [Alternaria panax]